MRRITLTLIIWAFCFASITAGAVLTYHWFQNRGPLITIKINDASGLMPGQSKIIFRGAQLGVIKTIKLDHDSDSLLIVARMDKQSQSFLGPDTKFWLVHPELELDEISNLSAIATGNYIGVLPSKGKFTSHFNAIDDEPVDPLTEAGLRIVLTTCNLSGISDDSAILYRGLEVGKVGKIDLSADRRQAIVTAYIYKQYSDIVRTSSYFANVSGFHANISIFGSSGLGMDSLQTLVAGGIMLKTPDLSAPRVKDGTRFKILTKEQLAQLEG